MRLNSGLAGGALTVLLAAASTGLAAEQSASQKAGEKQVIVNIVGCVELESDFRKRTGDRRGGTLTTGAGTGNEFVLTFAKSVPTTGVTTDAHYEPTGTTGLESVYAVTGNSEDALKREIGRQVQITGYVEVDNSKGTLKVKDLPRLNASTWTRIQDYCANPMKK